MASLEHCRKYFCLEVRLLEVILLNFVEILQKIQVFYEKVLESASLRSIASDVSLENAFIYDLEIRNKVSSPEPFHLNLSFLSIQPKSNGQEIISCSSSSVFFHVHFSCLSSSLFSISFSQSLSSFRIEVSARSEWMNPERIKFQKYLIEGVFVVTDVNHFSLTISTIVGLKQLIVHWQKRSRSGPKNSGSI